MKRLTFREGFEDAYVHLFMLMSMEKNFTGMKMRSDLSVFKWFETDGLIS